jgi:TetR/AcrR family transcriptional regulator, regulator of autoinduction and epiphytic fitness
MRQAKPDRVDRHLSPEKTAAILEGGMQQFLTHGYAATSMDRVAIAAKVSKATVYSHFQDKETLFIALIQQLVEQKFQSIFGTADAEILQMPPEVVLKNFADRAIDMGTTQPQFLNFMRLILGESERFPQLARAFVQHIERAAFSRLCQYFANCPHLKLSDPEVTARIFVGSLVHFMIVQEMLHGKDIVPMERDRLINGLVELILKQPGQGATSKEPPHTNS